MVSPTSLLFRVRVVGSLSSARSRCRARSVVAAASRSPAVVEVGRVPAFFNRHHRSSSSSALADAEAEARRRMRTSLPGPCSSSIFPLCVRPTDRRSAATAIAVRGAGCSGGSRSLSAVAEGGESSEAASEPLPSSVTRTPATADEHDAEHRPDGVAAPIDKAIAIAEAEATAGSSRKRGRTKAELISALHKLLDDDVNRVLAALSPSSDDADDGGGVDDRLSLLDDNDDEAGGGGSGDADGQDEDSREGEGWLSSSSPSSWPSSSSLSSSSFSTPSLSSPSSPVVATATLRERFERALKEREDHDGDFARRERLERRRERRRLEGRGMMRTPPNDVGGVGGGYRDDDSGGGYGGWNLGSGADSPVSSSSSPWLASSSSCGADDGGGGGGDGAESSSSHSFLSPGIAGLTTANTDDESDDLLAILEEKKGPTSDGNAIFNGIEARRNGGMGGNDDCCKGDGYRGAWGDNTLFEDTSSSPSSLSSVEMEAWDRSGGALFPKEAPTTSSSWSGAESDGWGVWTPGNDKNVIEAGGISMGSVGLSAATTTTAKRRVDDDGAPADVEEKHSLLDILKDDKVDYSFSGSFGGEAVSSPSSSSLTALLSSPPSPPSDAFAQTSGGGTGGSLMDLLNENYAAASGGRSVGSGTDSGGILFDLLDDDEAAAAREAKERPSVVAGGGGGGLLDLLNDDEAADSRGAKERSSVVAGRGGLQNFLDDAGDQHEVHIEGGEFQVTLSDAINEDRRGSSAAPSHPAGVSDAVVGWVSSNDDVIGGGASGKGTSDSLLNLLEGGEQSFAGAATKVDDSQEKMSLSTLIDAEQDDCDENSGGWGNDANGGGGDLVDLLDESTRDISSDDGETAQDSGNELMSLLDEAGEVSTSQPDGTWNVGVMSTADEETPYPIQDASNRAIALLSVMDKNDWVSLDYGEECGEGEEGGDFNSVCGDSDEHSKHDEHGDFDQTLTPHIDDNEDIHNDVTNTVNELLNGSISRHWTLTQEEFNMLLLHVATSAPRSHMAKLLLRIYNHMVELGKSGMDACAPNAVSFSILMLALQNRGNALSAASDVCLDMLKLRLQEETRDVEFGENGDTESRNAFELSEEVLDVGMQCLQRRNNVKDAARLLEWALGDAGNGVNVKSSVFQALLEMYKKDNNQGEAIRLLNACVKEIGEHDYVSTGKFLKSMVQWPRKGRDGRRIESSSLISAILDALEELNGESGYRPNYTLWKTMMIAAANSARFESSEHWGLVRRACAAMMSHLPDSWPDHVVLRYGLDAAEETRDPGLAYSLISWAWKAKQEIDDPTAFNEASCEDGFKSENAEVEGDESITGGFSSSAISHGVVTDEDSNSHSGWRGIDVPIEKPARHVHIPPQAFLRAVKLCTDHDELNYAHKIAKLCSEESGRVPEFMKLQVHNIVVAGYARKGDVDAAKEMLSEMQQEGPKPSEHTYAAVIHSLAVAKRTEEAKIMLDSLLENAYDDGVKPASSCFSACMLSMMQAGDWEGVLSLNQKMRDNGVAATPTSFHAVVLASSRLGDQTKLIRSIEKAIQSREPVDFKAFQLCAKLLLPEHLRGMGIPALRNKLRVMMDKKKDPEKAVHALALSRALRMAEMEESRHPRTKQDIETLTRTREKCWRLVLKSLVDLVQPDEASQ